MHRLAYTHIYIYRESYSPLDLHRGFLVVVG
jgi:hypothetical protein